MKKRFTIMMLLMPMLTGEGFAGASSVIFLAVGTTSFLFGVFAVRHGITAFVVPLLARMQSVELVVLFSLTVLGLGIGGAHLAALPPALGALAAPSLSITPTFVSDERRLRSTKPCSLAAPSWPKGAARSPLTPRPSRSMRPRPPSATAQRAARCALRAAALGRGLS